MPTKGVLEDPAGAASNAANAAVDGLANAASAAADGLQQAASQAGEFVVDLVPFLWVMLT